jgi:hypothetical protein
MMDRIERLELTEGYNRRKLGQHDEELHNKYSSPNILRRSKSKYDGKPEGRDNLEDLRVDRRILNCILRKWGKNDFSRSVY